LHGTGEDPRLLALRGMKTTGAFSVTVGSPRDRGRRTGVVRVVRGTDGGAFGVVAEATPS